MNNFNNIKWVIYGLIGCWLVYTMACSSGTTTEEVEYPTEGLITTVKEVETDLFKIEDEVTAPTPEESLIIAKYMDSTIDTFTLDEARLYSQVDGGRRSGVARAASYGFFGFMMGRSMGTHRPAASAYTNQKAHQRASSKAGSSIKKTAARKTVSKPKGRTGTGKGRSSRSYGG